MPPRGNIVRSLRHPRASDGRRQLVDHLRSGLGPHGGGDVSGTGEGAGTQKVADEVKDEGTVMNPTAKLAPEPIYILGTDPVLNLLDSRLSELAVLSWRVPRTNLK